MSRKKAAMSAAATMAGVATVAGAPDPVAAHSVTLVDPHRDATVIVDETHSDLTVCSWDPNGSARALYIIGPPPYDSIQRFEVEGYGCRTTRLLAGVSRIKACDESACTDWKSA